MLILAFPFISCHAQEGFLDTLDLGNITIDELSEKVKNKENIKVKRYINVIFGENDDIELKDGEISNDACDCKTIDYIQVFDPTIANYKGVLGRCARLTAYDNKIVEYEMDIDGVDNINKILDIVYAEHPDIKLIDDRTNRLKKYIDKNTVLQIWVNILNDPFVTISYTTNAEASTLWLYPNYDDKIAENVKRIYVEENEEGDVYVETDYIDEIAE